MSSLDKLTEALQKLQEEREIGLPPPTLPESISASEFVCSPGVENFLEEGRRYTELTKGVRVGQY
ncbi:MAG: hypothetical protein AABX66_02365 [Nanoarchaeota archaeon]